MEVHAQITRVVWLSGRRSADNLVPLRSEILNPSKLFRCFILLLPLARRPVRREASGSFGAARSFAAARRSSSAAAAASDMASSNEDSSGDLLTRLPHLLNFFLRDEWIGPKVCSNKRLRLEFLRKSDLYGMTWTCNLAICMRVGGSREPATCLWMFHSQSQIQEEAQGDAFVLNDRIHRFDHGVLRRFLVLTHENYFLFFFLFLSEVNGVSLSSSGRREMEARGGGSISTHRCPCCYFHGYQ